MVHGTAHRVDYWSVYFRRLRVASWRRTMNQAKAMGNANDASAQSA